MTGRCTIRLARKRLEVRPLLGGGLLLSRNVVLDLKPIHVTAALLMSDGEHTLDQVCKKVRRSRRTLERWQSDGDFASLLSDISEEIVKAVTRYQRAKALTAAQRIAALMEGGTKDDSVRLQAAQDILNRVMGKPAQRQILEGDEAKPLVWRVVDPRPQDKS